jgi:hypothetical protein
MTGESMEITNVKIIYLNDSKVHHAAQLIKNSGRYYYREGDKTMEIEKWEYARVFANPRLYYFSTALKLHNEIHWLKCERIVEGIPVRRLLDGTIWGCAGGQKPKRRRQSTSY